MRAVITPGHPLGDAGRDVFVRVRESGPVSSGWRFEKSISG